MLTHAMSYNNHADLGSDDLGLGEDPPINRSRISLDYKNLDLDSNMVTVEWTPEDNFCNLYFELHGYTLTNITMTSPVQVMTSHVRVITSNHSTMAEIPRAHLTTASEEPLYFRVVALDNGTVCSHGLTENTYYRFDGECRS